MAEAEGDSPKLPTEPGSHALWICDLQPGLPETQLRQLLDNYGDVVSLELVDCACEEAAVVTYASAEAADEARDMLNFAVVRGRTCRCMQLSSLELMLQTMDTGQRLVIENLDTGIEARGLCDLCALFGRVLDCKVELDSKEQSRGIAFVHYARLEDASKALNFMGGMQIGQSSVELRRFSRGDSALFSGCGYEFAGLAPPGGELEEEEDGEASAAGKQRARVSPQQRAQASMDHFKTLVEYHHVEVIEGLAAKLERLKALVETYDPNQDRQMVVVSHAENLRAVSTQLRDCMEASDFDSISSDAGKDRRREVLEGFDTGNIFALVLSSDASLSRSLELSKPPAILVNLDFPGSVSLHLYHLHRRVDAATRIHSFLSPGSDGALVVPLMSALEDAGHEIPPDLMELWSKTDDRNEGEER